MLATHSENKRKYNSSNYDLKFFERYPQPVDKRDYLFVYLNSPAEMLQHAAKFGDILLLTLLIDPKPITEREIELKKIQRKFQLVAEKTNRESLIRKTQIDIIETYFNYYGTEIFQHSDEIQSRLTYELDKLIYNLRLENRKHLAMSQNDPDSEVPLTLEWRVKLHKKFSLELLEECKNATFNPDLNQPRETIESFITFKEEYNTLLNIIDAHQKEAKPINAELKKINDEREELYSLHRKQKLIILLKLCHNRLIPEISLNDLISISKLHINPNTLDNFKNNLIHIAIANGEFETALFLEKKGLDLKEKNSRKVAALDMQDTNGNTLLHYLVNKGDFDKACDLIMSGANASILNNEKKSIFDITSKGSLIHFLLGKASVYSCKQKYFNSLLFIAKKYLKVFHLLIPNNEQVPVFIAATNLSYGRKMNFFAAFKENILSKELLSPFENDINEALWQHLRYLVLGDSQISLWKLFESLTKDSVINQVRFLATLENKILQAKKEQSDDILFKHLRDRLHKVKLPTKLFEVYITYIKYYQEKKKLLKFSCNQEEIYFIEQPKKFTQNHSKAQSYLLIKQRGLVANKSSKEEQEQFPEENKVEVFSSPLHRKVISKKSKEDNTDYLHWFDNNYVDNNVNEDLELSNTANSLLQNLK